MSLGPATYLGIINLPLRTFTTTYASLTGGAWTFNQYALQPMDYMGIIDVSDIFHPALQAVAATVFDNATGSTKFIYGNTGPPGSIRTAQSGSLLWKRESGNQGKLGGWLFNDPASVIPMNLSDTVTLGVPKTTSLQTVAPFAPLPNLPATAMPSAYSGQNFYTTQNVIYCPATINNIRNAVMFDPVTVGVVNLGPMVGSAFVATLSAVCAVPYNGINYIWCFDGAGGNPNKHVVQTSDWISGYLSDVPTLVNPPGASINLNTYINLLGTPDPMSVYNGFLWINRNALTITGAALNGFGILAAPNFSGYYLINFVPVDATAANWQNGTDEIQAKIDDTGVMMMHHATNQTTILATIPLPTTIPETYPPIPLPSPPSDSQITLRAMRGYAI